MSYRNDYLEIKATFDAMEWEETKQFPLCETLYDAIPRQLIDPKGVVTKEVPFIGNLDEDGTFNKDWVIFMPHISYPRYSRALKSIEPYWDHTVLLDQVGAIQYGYYRQLRVERPVTFCQLQNWMILWCRKKNIQNMIFMHDDAVLGDSNLIGRLLEAGETTDAALVYSHYDVCSLWKTERVLFNDEGFHCYYGDIDMCRRMRIFDIFRYSVINHGVEHAGNGTLNSGTEVLKKREAEIAADHTRYVTKWGGEIGEEKYLNPWGQE